MAKTQASKTDEHTMAGTRPVDPARKVRLRRLGDAIRGARMAAGLSQMDFGRLVGDLIHPGDEIPQTTISRWELGQVHMDVEQIHDIEQALKLAPGTLLRQAGYAEASHDGAHRSLEEIVREHPDLHADLRPQVAATIKTYTEFSVQLSVQDTKRTGARRRSRAARAS